MPAVSSVFWGRGAKLRNDSAQTVPFEECLYAPAVTCDGDLRRPGGVRAACKGAGGAGVWSVWEKGSLPGPVGDGQGMQSAAE